MILQPDQPWRPIYVVWPRRSITGNWLFGTVMMRCVRGEKQYRKLSAVEAWELWLDNAW